MVFDIGGVLAKISRTWAAAVEHAGLVSHAPESVLGPINDYEPLNQYQAGELLLEQYLPILATDLGLSLEEARRAHDHILREPYAGTGELIAALHQRRVATGCLSNTNDTHWEVLTGPRFPNIASLEHKHASHLLGVNKPDERIFRAFEEATGFDREAVVFFEDTLANIEGARAAGWDTVAIDPHSETAAQIESALRDRNIL